MAFHFSEDLIEKTAVFAVGCCQMAVAPSSEAIDKVITGGLGLLTIFGVRGLSALLGKKPECQKAVEHTIKKRPRDFQLANAADEAAVNRAAVALSAALDRELLFSPMGLRQALEKESHLVEALTAQGLAILGRNDPQFAAPGLPRDLAEWLLPEAFHAAWDACEEFRGHAVLTLLEIILESQRQLQAAVEEAARKTQASVKEVSDKVATKDDIAALRDMLLAELKQGRTQNTPQPDETIARAQKSAVQQILSSTDPQYAEARKAAERLDIDGVIAALLAAKTTNPSAEARRLRDAGALAAGRNVAQALEAYEKAAALDPSDPATWIAISHLRLWVGRTRDAEAAARQALKGALDPNEFAGACEALGSALLRQARLAEALKAYRESYDSLALAVKGGPSDAGIRRNLAVCCNRLGEIFLSMGHLDEASKIFHEGKTIREKQAQDQPGDMNAKRDLAISWGFIGDVEMRQGKFDDALSSFERGLKTFKAFAETSSPDMGWHRDMMLSYGRIGDALGLLGREKEAEKAMRASVEIAERLVKADETNLVLRGDYARGCLSLGQFLFKKKQPVQALEELQKAQTIFDELSVHDRDNAEIKTALAQSWGLMGDSSTLIERYDDALFAYNQSLQLQRRLAEQDSTNAAILCDLCFAYNRIGNVLTRQGKTAEALNNYRAGLAATKQAAAGAPGNPRILADLYISYRLVYGALAPKENRDELLETAEAMLALSRQVLELVPKEHYWEEQVWVCHGRLSDARVVQNDFTAGLQAARDALAWAERMAAASPEDKDWIRMVAQSYDRAGYVLSLQKNLKEARDAFLKSRTTLEPLMQTPQVETSMAYNYGVCTVKVAQISAMLGDRANACRYFTDANLLFGMLAKANPNWEEPGKLRDETAKSKAQHCG